MRLPVGWLEGLANAVLRRLFPCAYDDDAIVRHDYGFACSIYDAFNPTRNLVVGDDIESKRPPATVVEEQPERP